MLHTEQDQLALADVVDDQVVWFAESTVGACMGSKMILVRRPCLSRILAAAFTREQIAEQVRIALVTGNYDRSWLSGCIKALEVTNG